MHNTMTASIMGRYIIIHRIHFYTYGCTQHIFRFSSITTCTSVSKCVGLSNNSLSLNIHGGRRILHLYILFISAGLKYCTPVAAKLFSRRLRPTPMLRLIKKYKLDASYIQTLLFMFSYFGNYHKK